MIRSFLLSAVLLLVMVQSLSSQITSVKSIYFATGKYELSFIIKSKIDSVLYTIPESDSTQTVTLKKVFVNGHTDNVGDSIVNVKLSLKRTNSVIQYLLKKGISKSIIKQNYWGEDKPSKSNDNEMGKYHNRRVDIIFKYEITKIKKTTLVTIPLLVVESNPCNRDTLIDIPLGGKLKMKVCEYTKRKDCLSFEEINDPSALREGNNYTVDDTGEPLASGGMYNIKVCPENCLGKYITLLIPIRTICGVALPVPMNLYFITKKGWQLIPKALVKEKRIGVQKYYEVTFDLCQFAGSGGGRINFDFKIKNNKKTNFVAKDGLKIIEASIYSAGPLYSYKMSIKKSKNKASCKIPCSCQEPLAYIKAITPKGDTITMKDKPINRLNKKYTRGSCKTGSVFKDLKNLWVFRIKEKAVYRKYFLYELDFDNFKMN